MADLRLELQQRDTNEPVYHITIETVSRPDGLINATAYRTNVKTGERVKLEQMLWDADEKGLGWYIEEIRSLWPDAVGVKVERV